MTATMTADTTKELGILDKDDLIALKDSAKNGSAVVFRVSPLPPGTEVDYNTVFRGTVELSKRGDGRYVGDLSYDIGVPVSITDYGNTEGGYHQREHIATLSAFHMIHSPAYDEQWHTVVEFLREGDEVTLKWVRNNASQWTKERNIAIDQLSIEIYRRPKNPNGKAKRYTFLMGYSVTAPGYGRMVRSRSENL